MKHTPGSCCSTEDYDVREPRKKIEAVEVFRWTKVSMCLICEKAHEEEMREIKCLFIENDFILAERVEFPDCGIGIFECSCCFFVFSFMTDSVEAVHV